MRELIPSWRSRHFLLYTAPRGTVVTTLGADTKGGSMDIEYLQAKLREFARDRDWEQYHTPKNISIALSVEAAELLEIFQWMTPDE